MGVTGWLPLKEHSSRLPGKNWKPLAGKPLFWHMVNTLLNTPSIDEVIVNVDTEAAGERVRAEFGDRVYVIQRPPELCAPTTSTVELLLDDMQRAGYDLWVFTHCTAPLLRPETLDRAIHWYQTEGCQRYDSVISVTAIRERLYDGLGRAVNHNVHIQLPLQDLPPLYQENNAFFILDRETARKHHNRVGQRPYLWEIDRLEAVDIDYELDFQWAEWLHANAIAQSA